MEVIPAIDLIDGKCVRLYRGDFDKSSIYSEQPVEQAKKFEAMGFTRLHLVDLDGAKSGSPKHVHILEEICQHTELVVDFGGGIRTKDHLRKIQDAGATMASIGSLAVKLPEVFGEILEEFGNEFIFLGVDVKDEKILTSGWQEGSDITIFDFLRRELYAGIERIFCTDVNQDGTLEGPSFSLYSKILNEFPAMKLVASGGVSSIEDLIQLRERGLAGAIVGKALYEGRIDFQQLKDNNLI